MESESMEQDIMLDGNEDQMSTSNTSTNSGTCEANGCGKKSVSNHNLKIIISLLSQVTKVNCFKWKQMNRRRCIKLHFPLKMLLRDQKLPFIKA